MLAAFVVAGLQYKLRVSVPWQLLRHFCEHKGDEHGVGNILRPTNNSNNDNDNKENATTGALTS
jgi:hypothetical protein